MSNARIQTEILIGAIFIIVASVMLVYIGFTEEVSLAETEQRQLAESIEVGGELFTTNCARCHGEQGEGLIGPPLNDAFFFDDQNGRLKEIGWEGTRRDFIISVVVSGRPTSSRPEEWPGEAGPGYVMPPWSQDFGGPLRNDQIANIADYILNWERTAEGQESLDELLAIPGPVYGDPIAQGSFVFQAQGCAACHAIAGYSTGAVGPELTNIATAAATRIDGYSAEEYIRESILDPEAFIAPDCPTGPCAPGLMPADFSEKITPEALENLILFLMAQE